MQREELAVEPLARFVAEEREGIAAVLDAHEDWSLKNLESYSPLPASLRFLCCEGPVETGAFLAAIRVNPTLEYTGYRRLIMGEAADISGDGEVFLGWQDLSFLKMDDMLAGQRYRPLEEGERVSIAQVLATANDEPDRGMDVGLFTDNGTAHGQQYGFGTQPFGNPNLDYGSQAPFHMGFYHLEPLYRWGQPDLLRTYALWRIMQFRALADLAFETGHHYWAWRFMGWALHYIGDLTQPYHADPLPGVGTGSALWTLLTGKTEQAVQLVSNRHGVIESYQYLRVQDAMSGDRWEQPLLLSLRAPIAGANQDVVEWVTALTADSVARGEDLDNALSQWMPAQFVSDPTFEWVGSGQEPHLVDRVLAASGGAAVDALDAALEVHLARFAVAAGQWIHAGLEAAADYGVPMPVSWEMVSSLPAAPTGSVLMYGDAIDQQVFMLSSSARLVPTEPPTEAQTEAQPDSASEFAPVVLIHGGCWSSSFDYRHLVPLAAALSDRGHQVYLMEYRRVGQHGGGWPNTYTDVQTGLEALLPRLDDRPILIGHSAGGHLALLASQALGDAVAGVIGLAPITDLASYGQGSGSCHAMVDKLLATVPEPQRAVAMTAGSPSGAVAHSRTLLVRGSEDAIVGPDQITAMAPSQGDPESVSVIDIDGAAHFDLVHPGTRAFALWYEGLEELL